MNSQEINEATREELEARLVEISDPDPNNYDPMASLEAFAINYRLDSME
jgi:hypothetical protein